MPNEQNPNTAGISAVLIEKGFAHNDVYTVGAGGQTVFATTKEIGADVVLFEGGVISTKAANVTGAKEVTTDLIPQGTVVNILY